MNTHTGPSVEAVLQRLRTRQLMLLIALDSHRTLRKAAAALNTTQPAATKLLADLEAAVGHSLFERHRRGLQPNAFGDLMIRHAKMTLAEFDRTYQDMNALAAGSAGRLRIGVVPSAVPFFIARSVARLKKREPKLAVFVEVATSDVLIRSLAQGDLDILVARRWHTPEGAEFVYEGSIDEPLAMAVRVDHPLLTTHKPASWDDLAGWPWVLLPETSPMRQVLTPLFREQGWSRPHNLVETSSMLLMISLLQESDTIAVIPLDVLHSPACSHSLAALPIDIPPVMGAYGILTRRDRPSSVSSALFLEILRTVIGESRAAR